MSIAITRAASAFGRRLTEALLAAPACPELILLDPEPHRLGRATRERASVRHGDLSDPLSLAAGLAGARTLFLPGGMYGALAPEALRELIETARAVGVERLVLLSSIDPRPGNPALWAAADGATEAAVRSSGLGWTILRAQESLEAFITSGRRQQPSGRMFNNRDYGCGAPVALGDVVASIAAVLVDPAHAGHVYELTGPRLLGSGDLAGALDIDFIPHKDGKYLDQLLGEDLSRADAEREVSLGRAVRAGYYAVVTEDVRRLTGRPAIDLHDAMKSHIVLIGRARFLREVVRIMAARGEATRLVLADPDPAGLADLSGEGCVVRLADPAKPATLTQAFKGGMTLCLPGGGEGALTADQARTTLDAARAAGVERVVLLSTINAESPRNVSPTAAQDRALELLVQDSGMAWTVARLQERVEDLVELARGQVASRKLVTNRGHGLSAPITLSDAAAAVCALLLDHGHAGRFYSLTGPRLYGGGDVAPGLGMEAVLETDPRRLDRAFAALLGPAEQGQLLMGRAVRDGVYRVVTGDVEELIGRAPVDLHEFLES